MPTVMYLRSAEFALANSATANLSTGTMYDLKHACIYTYICTMVSYIHMVGTLSICCNQRSLVTGITPSRNQTPKPNLVVVLRTSSSSLDPLIRHAKEGPLGFQF